MLLNISTYIVGTVGIDTHALINASDMELAQKINWKERLDDFNDPVASYENKQSTRSKAFGAVAHIENLRLAAADPEAFPKPKDIYNVVIIAAYNEAYDVINTT